MMLRDGTLLYHGSYTAVERIDLSCCMAGKDFGRGFYLTDDYAQAERFVRASMRKAAKNGIALPSAGAGFVSVFRYEQRNGIALFEFGTADRDWLHCVAAHRRESGALRNELTKWQRYDILAGKIANDTTNQVLTAYINGLYGMPGSERADEIAISLLLLNRLSGQVCFKTETSLACLSFREARLTSRQGAAR